MDNAFTLPPTLLDLQTLAAEPGIGLTKYALHAQTDGPSMPIRFVCQLLTNVLLMLITETALLATKAMISPTENASTHSQTLLVPPILDVELGTGQIKFALSAPTDGSKMLMVFVPLSLTNVLLTLRMVTVLHATRAMILQMGPASLVPPTLPDLQI